MFELMNEMLELIYVADVNTHELLFMNTMGKERFHVGEIEGLKCYRVLQGLDAPCPFCSNKLLNMEETYNWSFTNPITEHHYILKDKLIDWEGRTARIEIAFDDTESENEKIALKNTLEAEKMVMGCAKQLYQTDDIAKTINSVLENIGIFLKAERTYIFDICGQEMFNTYEWCVPEVQPQIKNLQNLDVSLIEDWMPYFRRQECVILESLDEVKGSNPDTYRVLAKQGIRNLVAAPLEKEGVLVGYIGVDNPPADKVVNIAPLFRTLSYFLMAAMRKAEDEERLARLSYYDMLTGFYNRNRFMQDMALMNGFEESIGVAYLDINGLKDMNDRHGHSYGDQMLFLCARKIAEVFGIGDFYRIGGDEFLVVCKSIKESQFAMLAERVKEEFGNDQECHAAIGYLWAETVTDIQGLIAKADAMMYKDKERYYRDNPPTGRYRQWE